MGISTYGLSSLNFIFDTFMFIYSAGKESTAMQETPVRFLGQEVPLEKGEAAHSSILGLLWRLSC